MRWVAPVIIAAALVTAACGMAGESSERTPAVGPNAGPMRLPLEIMASVSKEAYLPGEMVTIELSLRNVTEETLTVRPFPPKLDVTLPWSREAIQSFAAGPGQVALQPGEERTHSLVWDQRDTSGRQVAPGYYDVQVDVFVGTAQMGTGSQNAGVDRILIQYPQGAMEKTVEVQQTVTANGVSIALERVEFSAKGTKLYASVVPPNYDYHEASGKGPDQPVPPPMSITPFEPEAEYTAGEAPRKLADGAFRPRESDIQIIWELDPTPSDARTFSFYITSLGRWSGPWQFQIPI